MGRKRPFLASLRRDDKAVYLGAPHAPNKHRVVSIAISFRVGTIFVDVIVLFIHRASSCFVKSISARFVARSYC